MGQRQVPTHRDDSNTKRSLREHPPRETSPKENHHSTGYSLAYKQWGACNWSSCNRHPAIQSSSKIAAASPLTSDPQQPGPTRLSAPLPNNPAYSPNVPSLTLMKMTIPSIQRMTCHWLQDRSLVCHRPQVIKQYWITIICNTQWITTWMACKNNTFRVYLHFTVNH